MSVFSILLSTLFIAANGEAAVVRTVPSAGSGAPGFAAPLAPMRFGMNGGPGAGVPANLDSALLLSGSPSLASLLTKPGIVERRGTGLLYLDLKDSTKLYRKLGVKKAFQTSEFFLEHASALARERGGTTARALGDGALFVFPDAGSALEAAADIQASVAGLQKAIGQPLSFHAAVHSGRVLFDGARGDVYGQSVERVLKLLELSRGSGIVADAGLISPQSGSPGAVLLRPAPKSASFSGGVQLPLGRTRVIKRATMFVELKGVSPAYDAYGRRRTVATVAAFQEFARVIVEQQGGEIVKVLGEGAMAGFPSAAAAIRAAALIQKRAAELKASVPLPGLVSIRAGISYGRVIEFTTLESRDFFGNTVNAAARLMQNAPGGAVLVSPAVRDQKEAAALLAESSVSNIRLDLKGLPAGFKAHRVAPESVPGTEPGESLIERLRRFAEGLMKAVRRARRQA